MRSKVSVGDILFLFLALATFFVIAILCFLIIAQEYAALVIALSTVAPKNADLLAQQEMALWAKWMLIVSIAGFGIGVGGFYFVRATYHEARETTRAAIASVHSGDKPRFRPGEVIVDVSAGGARVGKLLLRNIGGVDAQIQTANVGILIAERLPMRHPLEEVTSIVASDVPYKAGHTGWLSFNVRPISETEIRTVKTQTKKLFVVGRLIYKHTVLDASINTHALFAFRYDPIEKRFTPVNDRDYFHSCERD